MVSASGLSRHRNIGPTSTFSTPNMISRMVARSSSLTSPLSSFSYICGTTHTVRAMPHGSSPRRVQRSRWPPWRPTSRSPWMLTVDERWTERPRSAWRRCVRPPAVKTKSFHYFRWSCSSALPCFPDFREHLNIRRADVNIKKTVITCISCTGAYATDTFGYFMILIIILIMVLLFHCSDYWRCSFSLKVSEQKWH